MPKQRAVLAWDAGVETLILESDFSGKPGEYVWVIPVPGKPEIIEALKPGALETLQQTVPIPVATAHPEYAILGLLASLVAAGLALQRRRYASLGRWILMVTMVGAGVGALLLILFPVFATAKSGGGHYRLLVGSYNLAIYSGPAGMTLPASVPASMKPVLDDYQSEGWSVVVAKLRSDEAGLATPHPLKLRFRSPKPIYPMRLTGIDAKPLHLDLFVVGPSAATHPVLYRFATRPISTMWDFGEGGRTKVWLPNSHPDLVPLYKEGLVLTRLSGVLNPREMRSDLEVAWDRHSGTVTAIDPKEFLLHLIIRGMPPAAVVIILFAALSPPSRFSLLKSATLSLLLGATVAALTLWPAPRYVRSTGWRMVAASQSFRSLQVAIGNASTGTTAEECERRFRMHTEVVKAPERAIPGGFTVERGPGWVKITTYDARALGVTTKLPPAEPPRGGINAR